MNASRTGWRLTAKVSAISFSDNAWPGASVKRMIAWRRVA